MIVLDLEWNHSYDKTNHKILQIGAVKVDRLGGPVLDTFNCHPPEKRRRWRACGKKAVRAAGA